MWWWCVPNKEITAELNKHGLWFLSSKGLKPWCLGHSLLQRAGQALAAAHVVGKKFQKTTERENPLG